MEKEEYLKNSKNFYKTFKKQRLFSKKIQKTNIN